MFGITPMPIYDPKQEVSYLKEFMIFFRPGDIVKFKPVEREAYDQAVREVDSGRFSPVIRPISFDLRAYSQDPASYNQSLQGVLHGN